MHGTDNVQKDLIVLFFLPVFPLAPSENFFADVLDLDLINLLHDLT